MTRRMYEGVWPLPASKVDMGAVARLYAKVFAGEPWKEVSRCNRDVCREFSETKPEEQAVCKKCRQGICCLPAYPEAETVPYIRKELSKPNATGLIEVRLEDIRQTMEGILAFAWAYSVTGPQLAEEKYRLPEMQQKLQDLLKRGGIKDETFYISEVGVDPAEQGKGIGKKLTTSLANEGKRRFRNVVLRTNEESPMRRIAESLGMKPIIGLNSGVRDEENPARVVFIGGFDVR